MNSPRKYASPYLIGLPGLPPSSAEVVKSKKKSKTLVAAGTLSESAAAVKQVQDEIWQNARSVNSKTKTTSKSTPSEASFDDASSSGGIIVSNFFSEIENSTDDSTNTKEEDAEPPENFDATAEIKTETEMLGASKVTSNENLNINHASVGNSTAFNAVKEIIPSLSIGIDKCEENERSTKVQTYTVLRSILKVPSVNTINKQKGGKFLDSNSTGKKVNSIGKHSVRSKCGTPREDSLNETRRSTQHMEAHNKSSTRNKSKIQKSPRKTSKSLGNNCNKALHHGVPYEQKVVTFCNKVEVHTVPYEPRAGSKACDWQRNLLEQRVQTFRKLMTEVGSTNDAEFFGNALLFAGYPSHLYHPPNTNFGLRDDGPHRFGNFVSMPGTVRAKRNFK